MPLIVNAIANADERVKEKPLLEAGGLVDEVFFIALFNLAVPFGRLIDPWEIYLKLKRWWYEKPHKRL